MRFVPSFLDAGPLGSWSPADIRVGRGSRAMRVGYVRVRTVDQNAVGQLDGMRGGGHRVVLLLA
jgi:hypothetical protein